MRQRRCDARLDARHNPVRVVRNGVLALTFADGLGARLPFSTGCADRCRRRSHARGEGRGRRRDAHGDVAGRGRPRAGAPLRACSHGCVARSRHRRVIAQSASVSGRTQARDILPRRLPWAARASCDALLRPLLPGLEKPLYPSGVPVGSNPTPSVRQRRGSHGPDRVVVRELDSMRKRASAHRWVASPNRW